MSPIGELSLGAPSPATRSLAAVLRTALEPGNYAGLLAATIGVALSVSDPDRETHVNVVIAGSTVKIPRLGGVSTVPGASVYVLVTKDFLIAIGSMGGAVSGVPIGSVLPFAGPQAPTGYLLCDGSTYSKTDYALLFAIIGGAFGSTGTTFNVPDLRKRVAVGAGSGLGLASTDGAGEGSRGVKHHHSFSDSVSISVSVGISGTTSGDGNHNHGSAGGHVHDLPSGWMFAGTSGATAVVGTGGATRFIVGGTESYTTNQGAHTHNDAGSHSHSFSGSGSGSGSDTVSGDTSGGGPADGPSYAVLNYVIRAL